MSYDAYGQAPPVQTRRRGAVIGSLAALGVALALSVPLGFREAPGQVRRTPGGDVVELRGWTYGRAHTFIDGTGWQRLLRRVGLRQPEIGGYVGEASTGTDALVLWFRWIKPTQTQNELQNDWQGAWIDAHGCTIRADDGSSLCGPFEWEESLVSKQRFKTPAPDSFSERFAANPCTLPAGGSDHLSYALVRPGRKQPLATFTVPVVGGVRQAWTAKPLPARVTRGGTTFVLQGLRHHAPTAEHPLQRTTAEFRYEGVGTTGRNWMPAVVRVEDGWGGVLVNRLDSPWHEPATFDSLCLREAAWKLRIAFVRRDPMLIKPDQIVRIRNLSFDDQERTMRVDGIGELTCAIKSRHEKGLILLRGAPAEAVQLTLLAVGDSHSHRLLARNLGWSTVLIGPAHGPGSLGILAAKDGEFFLRLPRSTNRCDLTFGVYRPRVVEFLVRP